MLNKENSLIHDIHVYRRYGTYLSPSLYEMSMVFGIDLYLNFNNIVLREGEGGREGERERESKRC